MIDNISLKLNKDKSSCKGIIYKCYENTYFSSYGSIESKKSLRVLKSKSCKGCGFCGFERDFVQEDINEGNLKIDNCEGGKLYRLSIYTTQGYLDAYPEIDYAEFVEVKDNNGI